MKAHEIESCSKCGSKDFKVLIGNRLNAQVIDGEVILENAIPEQAFTVYCAKCYEFKELKLNKLLYEDNIRKDTEAYIKRTKEAKKEGV